MTLDHIPRTQLLALLSRAGSRDWAAYVAAKNHPTSDDDAAWRAYRRAHRIFHRLLAENERRHA